MKPSTKVGIGIAIGIGIMALVSRPKSRYREDDYNLLLPEFRKRIIQLMNNMRLRGYDPILFDSGRTQKEADKNAAKGTGIKDSLHLLGAAGDIISGSRGWSWPAFNKALAEESAKLNLTSGSTFSDDKKDPVHVQAIPVRLQVKFRKLTSPEARNLFIKNFYEMAA